MSTVGGPQRPGIVHRLDRDTSGVIVIARDDSAHVKLASQFEERSVEKEYFNSTIETYFQIASESILKTEIPGKNVNIDQNYRLFIHRAYENVYHDRIIKCIIW